MPTRARTNYAKAANRADPPADVKAAEKPAKTTTARKPRATASKAAAKPSAPATAPQKPPAPRRRKTATRERVRTLPVRITLDLNPTDHAALKRWCNQAAVDLDLPSVTLVAVMRLLGRELVANKDLAGAIRSGLETLAIEDDQARAHRH